jgi:RNA binding exosome subunit
LSILTAPGFPDDGALPEDLPEEIASALSEIAEHDPKAYQDLLQALRRNPDQARRAIAQHRQYLEELRLASENNEVKHKLLLQQEGITREVRKVVEKFHSTRNEEDRQALRTQLSERFSGWFDLRHKLRTLEFDGASARLEQERQKLERTREDTAEARLKWLERIVHSIRNAEEQGEAEEGDEEIPLHELRPLAPRVVQAVMRRDRQKGQQLLRLSKHHPRVFLEKIREIVAEHPEILEEAEEQLPEDEQNGLHAQMQDAIRSARKLIEPMVTEDFVIEIPEQNMDAVDEALQRLVHFEVKITEQNLGRASANLGEARRMLEFRRQNKDLIVETKVAEFTGRGDWYDW